MTELQFITTWLFTVAYMPTCLRLPDTGSPTHLSPEGLARGRKEVGGLGLRRMGRDGRMQSSASALSSARRLPVRARDEIKSLPA